jgi:membrane-associated phospholipid phosphatase
MRNSAAKVASSVIFASLLLAAITLPVGAQTADSAATARNLSLVSKDDVLPIAAGVALVAVAFAADRSVQRSFQSASVQSNDFFRQTANVAGSFADPGVIVFSAVTYVAGLSSRSRPVAALGMYTGEAVVLGGIVAEGMKGLAGRTRPKVDPAAVHTFSAGKGFSNDDFGSFPSAETTIAFAAATMSSRYVSRQWPGAAHVVTPVAYSLATLAGASRLYKNEHWASDVAAGALLGSAAAVEFDRWNTLHPNNVWERIFLPKSVDVRHGRESIAWTF